MTNFVAKRIRFRNGERHSILIRSGGLPVHEATLYLANYRTRGRAANTIHSVCTTLAFLYRWLQSSKIDLMERLKQGQFLTLPEINRLASAVQYRVADLSDEDAEELSKSKVVDIRRIQMRCKVAEQDNVAVDVATQASRLRYIAHYLKHVASYIGATFPLTQRSQFQIDTEHSLKGLLAHVPPVSQRAKVGARQGLSQEEQSRLLKAIRPGSPDNPWKRGFVQQRNWLIVVLLLATGMRRGELLGLQIGTSILDCPNFASSAEPTQARTLVCISRTPRPMTGKLNFGQLLCGWSGRTSTSKGET